MAVKAIYNLTIRTLEQIGFVPANENTTMREGHWRLESWPEDLSVGISICEKDMGLPGLLGHVTIAYCIGDYHIGQVYRVEFPILCSKPSAQEVIDRAVMAPYYVSCWEMTRGKPGEPGALLV